jgi:hypothetical protein
MMRLRGSLGVVAMLSVLLNAGAAVRHDLVVTAAAWRSHALLADLAGSLCRAQTGAERAAGPDTPPVPAPSDAPAVCPGCLGLATVFVLAGPAPEPAVALPTGSTAAGPGATAALPARPRTVHPPVRGPPAAEA